MDNKMVCCCSDRFVFTPHYINFKSVSWFKGWMSVWKAKVRHFMGFGRIWSLRNHDLRQKGQKVVNILPIRHFRWYRRQIYPPGKWERSLLFCWLVPLSYLHISQLSALIWNQSQTYISLMHQENCQSSWLRKSAPLFMSGYIDLYWISCQTWHVCAMFTAK